jgi:HK97 family phage prohead protease
MLYGSLVDLEEKALNEDADDAWTFRGYAAVFNNRDLGGDIIRPGAFKRSLKEHGLPLLLVQHKMQELPVGTLTDAGEDSKGFYVEGELPKEDPMARRVVGLLKPRKGARGLKGMSFGYVARKTTREKIEGKDTRVIHDLDCFEVSFVGLGMNPQAGVTALKGLSEPEWKELSEREREAHLKELGLTDGLAKRFIRLEREASSELKSSQREAGAEEYELPDFAGLILNAAKGISTQ